MNNAVLTNLVNDNIYSHFPLIRVNPEYGQPGAVDPAFLSSFDAFYPEAEGTGDLDDATGLVPLTANSVNYNQLQSYVELFSNTYISEGLYLFDRSFKPKQITILV